MVDSDVEELPQAGTEKDKKRNARSPGREAKKAHTSGTDGDAKARKADKEKRVKEFKEKGNTVVLIPLVNMLMKLSLKGAQSLRDLGGAVFDTFTGSTTLAEAASMSQQTTVYAKKTKEAGRGHKFGPPNIWAAGGLIHSLMKRGAAVGAAYADQIKAIWEAWEKMDIPEKCEVIQFCRLDKMYRADSKRITLAIRNAEWRVTINKAMENVGWTRKYGRAPASFMERDVQQWLEVFLGESKEG